MLLLILHSLQIVQILDVILDLVISMNAVVMIGRLLRFFAFALLAGLLLFVFPFMFCNETKRATAFDFYDCVSVMWTKHFLGSNSSALFHCIILHFLNHCMGRTCGIACHFLYY